MSRTVKIGIIGDYDAKKTSHPATDRAIQHAADYLGIRADAAWLPTHSFLKKEGLKTLGDYDGIWASSGSPYQNPEGALNAIRAARETKRPFIGT
jgi:CTP synthase (UTP-ammonia lyase)